METMKSDFNMKAFLKKLNFPFQRSYFFFKKIFHLIKELQIKVVNLPFDEND